MARYKKSGSNFTFSIRNFVKLELGGEQKKSVGIVSINPAQKVKGPLISFKKTQISEITK